MQKKLILAAFAACAQALTLNASVSTLLPTPKEVVAAGTTLLLSGSFTITDETGCQLLKDFFTDNQCTLGNGGLPVNVTLVTSITDAYDYTLYGYDNEAYTLEVTTSGINITAITKVGVIRAAQTLAQLAEGMDGQLECVKITDWPAFKLRGYMHDVGRSFIDIDEIKKEIKLLAQFKVNTFHWHLTENQAWRFQVNAYPQLTQDAYMTRFPGKYYTQDQCKEVVELAAKYGMVVIPEIDMPGHSTAFKNAMGFDMQSTSGKAALQTILEEAAVVFAGCPYIHIGADEVTITDSSFIKTMTDKIHNLGFKAVCWNPISGVTITSSTGFDMTQMWGSSAKKISGIPNIDCRYNYCNHFDVFADLNAIYRSNIYYAEKGSDEIAGSISAYWNDRITQTQTDIINQNNFYANVLATAERCWKGGGNQYIETGGCVLPNSGDEYEEFADWESRFLFHKAHSLKNEPIPYVKQSNVKWYVTQGFPNSGNVSTKFPPEDALQDTYTYNGTTYTTQPVTGAGVYLKHTWGSYVPGLYPSAAYNQTAYAYTYVYSPTARTVGAQIEFQNYGRSEKDLAPTAGNWDYKGSKVIVNGEEIAPPTWDNSGVTISNEVYLKNENFSARKPVKVTLKEGWNTVLLKLPYIQLSTSTVRLNKWMFTFVLTDEDGVNAIDDVVYSPTKTLDSRTENLVSLIQEIRSYIANNYKEEVGYYSASTPAVKEMLAAIDEAEKLVANATSMTDAQITSTYNSLSAQYTTLKSSLASSNLAQPEAYTYYYLSTPLREGRYISDSNGVPLGTTSYDANSEWEFMSRGDGSYDIKNYNTGRYIAPVSTYNSPLEMSTTAPATGWELQMSSTTGYVILVNGENEMNQTRNQNLGYKVYNWGYGSKVDGAYNYDDQGCEILFTKTGRLDTSGVGNIAADTATLNPFISFGNGSVTLNTGVYGVAYNMQGMLIGQGFDTLYLPKGPAIIVANGQTYKVMIR